MFFCFCYRQVSYSWPFPVSNVVQWFTYLDSNMFYIYQYGRLAQVGPGRDLECDFGNMNAVDFNKGHNGGNLFVNRRTIQVQIRNFTLSI